MKLPVVSGNEAVKAFQKIGYKFDEQHGSISFCDLVTPLFEKLD